MNGRMDGEQAGRQVGGLSDYLRGTCICAILPSSILRENRVPNMEMPARTTTQKYLRGKKEEPAEKAKREEAKAGEKARAKH